MAAHRELQIDENAIRRFAETFILVFRNTRVLDKISSLVLFDGQQRNFSQIGKRTYLPKEFFTPDQSIDTRPLAGDFASSIVNGEENFLITYISEEARRENVPVSFIQDLTYDQFVRSCLERVPHPTAALIPIEFDLFNRIQEWIYEQHLGFDENHKLFLRMGDHNVRIIWSTKFTPFDNPIILDSTGIRVKQKLFRDIQEPTGLGRILYTFGEGTPLRLDFAESDKEAQLDFVFRTVISIDGISPDSAVVLRLPESP